MLSEGGEHEAKVLCMRTKLFFYAYTEREEEYHEEKRFHAY